MKKYPLLILFAILYVAASGQDTTNTMQQQQAKSSLKDKMYYGGYVDVTFGSYTVIGAEPMIGFKLTPKLSAGIKIRYDYVVDKRYAVSQTTSMYGGSIFARYRIIPQLYLHGEYSMYNYELFGLNGESDREWVPFLFVGAGYSKNLGRNVWLNAQVLFDVLQSSNSPYNNWEPFYSVGINVGF